jgi:hypothetical protein
MMNLPQKLGTVKRSCVVLLLNTLVVPFSHACRTPPMEQVVTPEQQIAIATDVSVARVIRATPSPLPASGGRPSVEYEFEVEERILGPDEPRFVIIGARGETRPRPGSTDHSDKEFWERGGGRLCNDSDCVLRPNFTVGERYLVFRGNPATWRSFERIEFVRGRPNAEDKWLAYVKARLGGQH